MRARDEVRIATLRLTLAALRSAEKELQRPLKEDEELQVLQRERKRRAEAAAPSATPGARSRPTRKSELAIIEEFMPEPLSEEELEGIVDDAIAETGATSLRDLGRVMADVMPQVAGRADGSDREPAGSREARLTADAPALARAVVTLARATGALSRRRTPVGARRTGGGRGRSRRVRMPGARRLHFEALQDVLSVSNEVAAELATVDDGILAALRDRIGCAIRLRGNQLTLEGTSGKVGRARARHRRARRARRGRARDRAEHGRRRARGARRGRGSARGLRGRHLAPPRQEDHAEDGQPEALRRRDPRLHDHVRHRARRDREDVPGDGARRRRARRPRGEPHHPHAAGGRGRRAARLPARRHAGQGRPVPQAALRRALRHARRRPAQRLHREGDDRGRAARVHARPHAERLVHHPRRGAEHDAGADADVPDAARLRLQGRRHRRRHPDRPAPRPGLRPHPRAARSSAKVDGIEFVEFGNQDVVRHVLVQRIVEAYKRHAEETGTQRRR